MEEVGWAFLTQMTFLSIHPLIIVFVCAGEFGIVYRAQLFLDSSDSPTVVAAKTVQGPWFVKLVNFSPYFQKFLFCCAGAIDKEEVDDLLKESLKMKQFDHPNVMGLMGVCVDAGPNPFLILPFMSGGSLLSYLRMHQYELLLPTERADESDVCFLMNSSIMVHAQSCKLVQELMYASNLH